MQIFHLVLGGQKLLLQSLFRLLEGLNFHSQIVPGLLGRHQVSLLLQVFELFAGGFSFSNLGGEFRLEGTDFF